MGVAKAADALYLSEEAFREDIQQRGLSCSESTAQRWI